METKTEKEVVIAKGKTCNSTPADMIQLAISGGADLDKLEKLLILQEKWEANEARKAFASSFAIVQANIASVFKTKINPQTHSKYADLNDIIESAKPIYTREGFSIIFYEGETTVAENIRICADVLHTTGHKETYHYDVPLDGLGIKGNANMTKIHGKSSSTSYGRRYLMAMIWNIPTADDDGNKAGAPVEFISVAEQHQLADLMIANNISEKKFFEYMKVAALAEIPKAELQKATIAINSGKKAPVKK